ncbi:hypothetical protein BC826DRAFT_1022982, partial [Russula brevipes]
CERGVGCGRAGGRFCTPCGCRGVGVGNDAGPGCGKWPGGLAVASERGWGMTGDVSGVGAWVCGVVGQRGWGMAGGQQRKLEKWRCHDEFRGWLRRR